MSLQDKIKRLENIEEQARLEMDAACSGIWISDFKRFDRACRRLVRAEDLRCDLEDIQEKLRHYR